MNNSEYWEQRVANETWRTYNSLEEKNRDLLKMYQEASLDLQEELYQVTQKINGGQGVSLSDMHKHNRLTNLQKNMEYRIRQLGEDVEKFGKDNMKSGIKDVYSNVIGSLDVSNFSLPNEKLMEKMFNTPWQSDTFSNRLWKNTQKLATNLNDILTIGLTQGKTVTEMAINLNNQMNQGFNVSHRLIRTETMHYLNESAFKAYEDGGCTEVQLWAAEDERMCEVCGKKHGQKYTLKDRPTLPLHANCRCTYLPVVDMNKVEENNRVIQEQIERIKELEKNVSKSGKSDIINTGATSGALNPYSDEAQNHANKYYASVLHMKTDAQNISMNVGWSQNSIDQIKEHVFIKEHDLGNISKERFSPSYDMAQSWQRLIEGKNIKEQDLVLLKHEYLELTLMKKGLSQAEAHIIASQKHNFAKYTK